jgi:hypothetical protein
MVASGDEPDRRATEPVRTTLQQVTDAVKLAAWGSKLLYYLVRIWGFLQ